MSVTLTEEAMRVLLVQILGERFVATITGSYLHWLTNACQLKMIEETRCNPEA